VNQEQEKLLLNKKLEEKNTKDPRKEWGAQGEEEAMFFLQAQGFQLDKRNWNVRSTLDSKKRIQVDLVVSKGDRSYVVEVKKHLWMSSGFEFLISHEQRKRLLLFTNSLQRLKYRQKSWGFMLIWISKKRAKILEQIEPEEFS
jgi:Holliday junction resolvase-like predicted endonuclease